MCEVVGLGLYWKLMRVVCEVVQQLGFYMGLFLLDVGNRVKLC